jgi:hypothetical protein
MRRGVIARVLVGVLALTVGACGGGNGGGSSDQEYVDALVANFEADDETPESIDADDARCLAEAILDTYGAEAFEAADLTVTDVRDPATDLSQVAEPSDEQAQELGAALQACGVGDGFASVFAEGFEMGADGEECLADRFDNDNGVARFLGASMLSNTLPERDARVIVDVLAECIDLGGEVMRQSGLELTEAEIACLGTELEGTEAFKKFMAQTMAGEDVSEDAFAAATLSSMTTCLTPERMAEIGADDAGAGT